MSGTCPLYGGGLPLPLVRTNELFPVGNKLNAVRGAVANNDIHGPRRSRLPESEAHGCFRVGGGDAVGVVKLWMLRVQLDNNHLTMCVDHDKMVGMVGTIALADELVGLVGAGIAVVEIVLPICPPGSKR